jgi:hypothetical protein
MFDERFIELVLKELHKHGIHELSCRRKTLNLQGDVKYELDQFRIDSRHLVCELEAPVRIDRRLFDERIVRSEPQREWEDSLESDSEARIDLCIAIENHRAIAIEIKLGENGPTKIKNDLLGEQVRRNKVAKKRIAGTAPSLLARNFNSELEGANLFTKFTSDHVVREVDPCWVAVFRDQRLRDLFVKNHIGDQDDNKVRIKNSQHWLMPHWLIAATDVIDLLPRKAVASCLDCFVEMIRNDVIHHFDIDIEDKDRTT